MRALFVTLLMAMMIAPAEAADDRDIEVKVRVDSDTVLVDVDMLIAASPREVWTVMTDFDHMASFISNLKSSRVVARGDDRLTVQQEGQASYGPVSYKFESIRELRLWPISGVHSRMISGNMKRFEGATRFVPEATGTRVLYHSESVPKAWVPPVVGPRFIERETREQFGEFRAEIMRRKAAPAERTAAP
jgi:ribosome-associated toxin RatA of RatAB toxin-antitoxin module